MDYAIIFDLDGVITDTAHLHYKAWNTTAKKIGIELNHSMNEQLKGLSRMDSLEVLLSFSSGAYVFSEVEKQELAKEKNADYRQLMTTLTPEDVLPGIKKLLHRLKDNNIPIGLASASHNAPEVLKRLELDHYVHHIADPALVENGKPAPDLFILASKMLKVPPKKCIGIEDATSGVQAIKSAGMYAIGVGDKELLKEANYIVPNTKELTYNLITSIWHHEMY